MPALDYALVPYKDCEQYDNWDRISEPLFETLVTEPCVFAAVGEIGLRTLTVRRYGYLGDNGSWNAYIALDDVVPRHFVGLSSGTSPFDSFSILNYDGRSILNGYVAETMPLIDASFVFIFSAPDETQQRLSNVDLEAK